jgi:D-aminopeptidase
MFLRVCFGCHVLEGYGMTGACLGRHWLPVVLLVGDASAVGRDKRLGCCLGGTVSVVNRP